MHHIAVDATLQRRGIGRQLIAAAVAIGRKEEVDAVMLDSWSFNRDAHTFFEAEDFAPLNAVFERRLC